MKNSEFYTKLVHPNMIGNFETYTLHMHPINFLFKRGNDYVMHN